MRASRILPSVGDHLIEISLSVVLAYGTYLAADALHQSGVIATAVAGIVLGNYGRRLGLSKRTEEALDTVWEFVAFLATAFVFLVVGFAISVRSLADVAVPDRLGDRGDARRPGDHRLRAAWAARRLARQPGRVGPAPRRGRSVRVRRRRGPRRRRHSVRLAARRLLVRPARRRLDGPRALSADRLPEPRCFRASPSGSSCSRCWSRPRRPTWSSAAGAKAARHRKPGRSRVGGGRMAADRQSKWRSNPAAEQTPSGPRLADERGRGSAGGSSSPAGEEARYLSHLDAVKLWERAFRRGEIPVATSEGFSPRPRLVFAAPLPLGMLAEHELADLFSGRTADRPGPARSAGRRDAARLSGHGSPRRLGRRRRRCARSSSRPTTA